MLFFKRTLEGFASMKNLCTYLCTIILLFTGCGKQSDSTLVEKAEKLSRQSSEEISAKRYVKAEALLSESIEIYSAVNNTTKLAEQYASLASVQMLTGKLHPALQTLSTLRNLYSQSSSRNAELKMMLEIGRINFKLGRVRQAIAVLDEAYLSSQLFQMHEYFGASAFELAKIHSAANQHHKASGYYAEASAQFIQLGDTLNSLKAIIGNIESLLRIGNNGEAAEYLNEFENLVQQKGTHVNVSAAYSLCGSMFLRVEQYALARNCFQRALSFTPETEDSLKALIGLGEVYVGNFAFNEARDNFTKAYAIAQQQSGSTVQAYLLIRIADCESKIAALSPSADKLLRAQQLYESAQSLFVKASFGAGESITLHRLGILKELSHDDNSAITLYKRAFEKFIDNNMNEEYLELPINWRALYSLPASKLLPEAWFTDRLAALLLKYNRFAEALDYIERSRSLTLARSVTELDIKFHNKEMQNVYDQLISAALLKEEYQLELIHFNKAAEATNVMDKDYAQQLLQKIMQFRISYSSAASLLDTQPDLKILSPEIKAPVTATQYVPAATTALSYYFAGNEAWLFVIRQGKDISAVKLSGSGLELKKKMTLFNSMLLTSGKQWLEVQRLSRELYSSLIKPAEQFGQQRLLIIPPQQMEKFPFHALVKEGKSLVEMIEVSYLPSVFFLRQRKQLHQAITNVVAIGFSQDSRWGLEFELRDIRSFFHNAQVFVNQSATAERLISSSGEMLQLSSVFHKTPDNQLTVTLSDGTASIVGTDVSISVFPSCNSFNVVYLSDVQTATNAIDKEHSLLWLLNGTPAVITTEFPLSQKMSRIFGENFYSSLSTNTPYLSYRRAMIQLAAQKEFSDDLSFASYFYYGI